jgi:aspartyl protease family protein
MTLGETRVVVRIYGPKGYSDVEMVADTGATLTAIPETIADEIGLVRGGHVVVKFADGTRKAVAVGDAEIEIRGERAPVRVLVGPAGQVSLVGLTSLETLGLKVNPVERRLEPSEFTLYAVAR